jgi:UDP-GlcNAc:undecaprenyl-phosphate GlcNAc-1-phosphate transferase
MLRATSIPPEFPRLQTALDMPAAPQAFFILLLLSSLAASTLVCLNANAIGRKLHVMDHPDEERKRHPRATPLVGGLAMMIPVVIWLCGVLAADSAPDLRLYLALLLCGAGVAVVGFTDDQSSTTPLSRILSLLVFLAVAFVTAPALIASSLQFGSFEALAIPAWGFCLLMAVASVGVVNAVNMADGQNGLVSGMYIVWATCLTLLGDPAVASAALVVLGAAVIVFGFNLRGRLFLGDCGTYGVTFTIGLLCMFAHARGELPIEVITVWFFIPVMDCLRLLVSRKLSGRSAVQGDRDHLHHRLMDRLGPDYGRVAYLGVVATTSVIAILAPHLALVCLVLLTAFYFSFAWLSEPAGAAQREDVLSSDGQALLSAGQEASKVVAMTRRGAGAQSRGE